MNRLEGMTALVTGGSAGIGEAIVRRFAAEGCRVLVHGRDERRTTALAEDLGAAAVLADLAEETGVERVVDAVAQSGGLDILVNNAGHEVDMTVDQIDRALLERMLRVNFVAPVELVRRLLPDLSRSGRGSVINVTSIHESVAVAGNSGYAATKAALAAYTRSAAVELGPRGVRVNNLAPGAVRTAMNAALIEEIGDSRFARWIPAGRVGHPDDIGGAAVFLAGSEARYITGSTLTVDGGYSQNLVRYAADPG